MCGCNEEKSVLTEFHKTPREPIGVVSQCKCCRSKTEKKKKKGQVATTPLQLNEIKTKRTILVKNYAVLAKNGGIIKTITKIKT